MARAGFLSAGRSRTIQLGFFNLIRGLFLGFPVVRESLGVFLWPVSEGLRVFRVFMGCIMVFSVVLWGSWPVTKTKSSVFPSDGRPNYKI